MAGTVILSLLAAAGAAQPFSSATLTKVENKVLLGERRGDQSATRPAAVADIVRASNFLRSESQSRAEIQYPDGSLVRIGQNTVFTFDADSRTLTLDKGSLLFHIPKGSGGGTIKTASLTAAITGTAGKISTNIIAIVSGTVQLLPSRRLVHAMEFARMEGDGSITIAPLDPEHVNDGVLPHFNGPMPGFPANAVVAQTTPTPSVALPDLRFLDVLQRTQNLPGSVDRFFPIVVHKKEKDEEEVPPPKNNPDGGNGGKKNPNNY